MTKSPLHAFPFVIAIFFACATVPAFAQHGGGGGGFHGGGGGGGFHGGGGGGGFHGGGGGGFHGGGGVGGGSFHSGGGFRGGPSAPPAGYGSGRYGGGAPMRPGGGSFAPPRGGSSRPNGPGGSYPGGMQRGGNSFSGAPAPSDGHWHSFGGPTGGRGPLGPQSAGPNANPGGGFHTFGGNRSAGPAGATRSFSGQGREVWENGAMARNVIPSSQALSGLKQSFRGSGSSVGNLGIRSNSSHFGSSRFNGGSTLLANRNFSGIRRPIGLQPGRGSFGGFGFGNRFGNRFHHGCWNCGFGFGGFGFGGFGFGGWGFGFGGWPGWGWGSPWLGYWGWDPFWSSPWWGWGAPGYGYGPVYNNYYGYPYYDNSAPPPADNNYDNNTGNNGGGDSYSGPEPSTAPAEQSPNVNGNSLSLKLSVPVLIYMKDGAVYSARDYWITEEEFNLVLMDGEQKSFSLDEVDLPRTNEENAKSGVKFILKSDPTVPTPGENFAPNQPGLQPDGSGQTPRTPAPSHQLHVNPQPDART